MEIDASIWDRVGSGVGGQAALARGRPPFRDWAACTDGTTRAGSLPWDWQCARPTRRAESMSPVEWVHWPRSPCGGPAVVGLDPQSDSPDQAVLVFLPHPPMPPMAGGFDWSTHSLIGQDLGRVLPQWPEPRSGLGGAACGWVSGEMDPNQIQGCCGTLRAPFPKRPVRAQVSLPVQRGCTPPSIARAQNPVWPFPPSRGCCRRDPVPIPSPKSGEEAPSPTGVRRCGAICR